MPMAAPEQEPTEAPVVAFEQATEVETEEETVESELDVFVPPDEIELASNGKKIPFPKLTWRLQAKILTIFGELVQAVPELKKIDFMNFDPKDFLGIATELMITAPEYVDKLIMLAYPSMTDVDMDELATADVADLLIPLFYAVADDLLTLMGKISGRTSMR